MVKQIVWTIRARGDRKKIFEYWNSHNKSTVYSTKLNILIKQSLNLIGKYPQIGKKTNFDQVRLRIIRNYFLFYKVTDRHIVVLSVWDCNQDITDLKL